MDILLSILLLTIKYSRYWPPAGGSNCSTFVDGQCLSRTASGARWQDWVDKGCACPVEWPFGTTVELDGQVWTCVDRGGKVRFGEDGLTYIDFLSPTSAYGYGELVEAKITITSPVSNIPGLVVVSSSSEDSELFEPEVLTLEDLGAGEVDSTEGENQVHPTFEADREWLPPDSSQDTVQSDTDTYTEDDSQVPLDSGYGDPQLRLNELLGLEEPLSDEWPVQEPVHEYHRQSVLDDCQKYAYE